MSISLIIKDLRAKKKLSQKEVSDILGLKQSTFSEYESGRIEPNITLLGKLSDFYDVSVDYLLGRTNTNSENTIFVENKSIATYEKPNVIYINSMAQGGTSYVPQLSQSSGVMTYIPDLPIRSEPYIMIRVAGASMEPTYKDGCYVVCYHIKEKSHLLIDAVHVVTTSDSVYLKEVRFLNKQAKEFPGHFRLSSLSPNYEPIYLHPDEDRPEFYRVVCVINHT